MTTNTLDLEDLAKLVRVLLAVAPQLDARVLVTADSLTVEALKSDNRPDDHDQRCPLYARLDRQSKGRAYYASTRSGGWRVTNDGGYGSAETRTFGATPDPEKLASSIADVARKRAAKLAANRAERDAYQAALDKNIVTLREIAVVLGIELGPDYIHHEVSNEVAVASPEHGTDRVVVKLKNFRSQALRCWPDEINDAIVALQSWQRDVSRLGQERD